LKARRSRLSPKNPPPLRKSKKEAANENSTSSTHQLASFGALPWHSGVWLRSFIDWHTRHGFAAFPYTPQANGYFRRLDNGTIAQASDLVKVLFHHPQNENRFRRIKALQSETGYDLGQIVLGYLLGQPFPVFPIIGPRKVADLDESIRAADVSLTADHLEFLTAAT
jgi:aryl-alcohol dehydrogenase-like predicted oxidoreductase